MQFDGDLRFQVTQLTTMYITLAELRTLSAPTHPAQVGTVVAQVGRSDDSAGG